MAFWSNWFAKRRERKVEEAAYRKAVIDGDWNTAFGMELDDDPLVVDEAQQLYARVRGPSGPAWEKLTNEDRTWWIRGGSDDPNGPVEYGWYGRDPKHFNWDGQVHVREGDEIVSGTEYDLAQNRTLADRLAEEGHSPIVWTATIRKRDGHTYTAQVVGSRCHPDCEGCEEVKQEILNNLDEAEQGDIPRRVKAIEKILGITHSPDHPWDGNYEITDIPDEISLGFTTLPRNRKR